MKLLGYRFSYRGVLGVLLVAFALASTGKAASASSCPQPMFYAPNPGGSIYLLRFINYEDVSGDAALTLYTAHASYPVALRISVESVPHADSTSSLYSIAMPTAEAIVGATMAFTDRLGARCDKTFEVSKLAGTVSSFRGDSATATPVDLGAGEPEDAPKCAKPYASAVVEKPVEPIFPIGTSFPGRTANVKVLVDIAPDATIYRASIAKASGVDALDAAAMTAATSSRYKPAIFRCVQIEGTYIFNVSFQKW